MRATLLSMVCMLFALAACGQEPVVSKFYDDPTIAIDEPVVSTVYESYIVTEHYGASVASLEERVYVSDVVVRASLVSTGDDTLTFRAIEYLKGTGDAQISVSASTAGRNTSYDNREAVLFLKHSSSQPPGGSSSGSKSPGNPRSSPFAFTDSTAMSWAGSGSLLHSYTGNLPEGYTIDSRNPVWLPATRETSTSNRRSTVIVPNPSYFTERKEPAGAALPTATLQDIRDSVAWIEDGEDVAGYDGCVLTAIGYNRENRDRAAFYGEAWKPYPTEGSIASGAPAGTFITRWDDLYHLGEAPSPPHVFRGDPLYNREWLTGPDSDLFVVNIVDDDTDASNGYHFEEQNTRPLPKGDYRFLSHSQGQWYFPCDFIPDQAVLDWTIHVIAPPGTLHEAFFDPVSSGDAVGYFGAGDALKPTSFSIGDVSTTIQSLRWQDSAVTLGLQPYNALAGQILDFITGDGTTSLSLEASAATGDSTAGTLTWAVGSQPWSSGDQLMLRIRDSNTPPTFAQDAYTFSVAESTSAFTVIGTVKAVDQDGDTVLHKITGGNEGGWFSIDGWEGFILVSGRLDYETKSSYELTVTGTDPGGRSATTTATINVTDVAE